MLCLCKECQLKLASIDTDTDDVVYLSSAGVFCAVVSHPADSVVSLLNKERGSSAVEVVKRLGPVGESLHMHIYNTVYQITKKKPEGFVLP